MARKSFLLRIEKGLYDEIESWAQQEMRSVNGQIEYLLRQAILKYRGKGQIMDLRRHQKELDDTLE